MKKKEVSILIVNFNSSQFIELSLFALKNLTKRTYQVFIMDNGSEQGDYESLLRASEGHDNVFIEKRDKEFDSASLEHGTALNLLIKKVDTPYFSILDADAIWLKKDWDEILINRMNKEVKVIGTQAPAGKPQDFPLMFAILFKTESFLKANIDFRPENIGLRQDTGFEIREKYLKLGFKGINIEMQNTRTYKNGPFAELICAEYYLEGLNGVFASHFGRGSTLGENKYSKGLNKFIYQVPLLGRYLVRSKGLEEKRKWINICKKTIDNQIMKSIELEKVSCDFCGSKRHKKLFSSHDYYNNGLPGIFDVVKCKECNLVFTNPRPTRDSIGIYYPNTAGYFQPFSSKQKKHISAKVYNGALNKYFKYFIKNEYTGLLSVLLSPLYFYRRKKMKIQGVPDFIENGKLLDIGCSSGAFLYDMKKIGWKVKGIEQNKKAVDFAKSKHGLDVECINLYEFETSDRFDVITLRMVLEHVHSPRETILKARKFLKKGGVLIIIIPDFSGFEAMLYKKFAYTLHLPTHLTHFTPRTVTNYLDSAGFKNFKIYHHQFDRDLIAPLEYMKREGYPVGFFRKILINKVVRSVVVKLFVSVLSFFGKTSRMTIYANKIN